MTQPDSTTPDAPAADEPDTGTADDRAAEVEKWKSLARKHEAAAKANTKAAERLAELEQAQLTEQQRLERAVEEANRARDESQSELVRLRVALRHGISDDDLDLLGSGTEEQIEARAERVAALKAEAAAAVTPTTPAPTPTTRRPTEQLRSGASPDAPITPADRSPRSLIAAGIAASDATKGA